MYVCIYIYVLIFKDISTLKGCLTAGQVIKHLIAF